MPDDGRGGHRRAGTEPGRGRIAGAGRRRSATYRASGDLPRRHRPCVRPLAEAPSTLPLMVNLPDQLQREYPLWRLTTIRTGGAAEFFAKVGTVEELERLLRWAKAEQIEVGV